MQRWDRFAIIHRFYRGIVELVPYHGILFDTQKCMKGKLLVIIYRFRTLIEGDPIAGFTIFWADDGLDTGPILLTRECTVLDTDTLDTLYKRFLYPVGVTAMG